MKERTNNTIKSTALNIPYYTELKLMRLRIELNDETMKQFIASRCSKLLSNSNVLNEVHTL